MHLRNKRLLSAQREKFRPEAIKGEEMSREEIYSRRSIRKYKKEVPPLKVIDEILDAGRVAPSGSNRQPWKFLVFVNEQKERFLDAMEAGIKRERHGERKQNGEARLLSYHTDPRYGYYTNVNTLRTLREAPVTVVVINPYGRDPFKDITPQERVSELIDTLSIGAAIENMLLRAEELGIGGLWAAATYWAYQELMEFTGAQGQLVCAVALGYADETPSVRPRKELGDIVEYHIDDQMKIETL